MTKTTRTRRNPSQRIEDACDEIVAAVCQTERYVAEADDRDEADYAMTVLKRWRAWALDLANGRHGAPEVDWASYVHQSQKPLAVEIGGVYRMGGAALIKVLDITSKGKGESITAAVLAEDAETVLVPSMKVMRANLTPA